MEKWEYALTSDTEREFSELPDEDIATRIPGAKVFSKFDVTSSDWQLPLADESSCVTMFNTPWGRFYYTEL